jgi:hypothetical protein
MGQSALFNKFNERDIRRDILGGGKVSQSVVDRICVYNSGNAIMIPADRWDLSLWTL